MPFPTLLPATITDGVQPNTVTKESNNTLSDPDIESENLHWNK